MLLGNSLISRLGLVLVGMALASWSRGDGWTAVPTTTAFSIHQPRMRVRALLANGGGSCVSKTALAVSDKPKRRKRKITSNDDSSTDDSLPDFDIADETSTTSAAGSSSQPKSGGAVRGANRMEQPKSADTGSFGAITPAMMGSSYQKEISVSDLLRDRSLESQFQFDDDEGADTTLPDLAALPNKGAVPPLEGKKKVRQAARMAAATAAAQKKQQEEEGNILSKIPFIRDEKGEVSALKILENGTWLGIGLLVGWELYINTPFFDRAQPMIPVIYDIVWFT